MAVAPSVHPAPSQRPALECMEIWSGNERAIDAVSVPGIDVWVLSEPFQGQARGGDVHYVSLCGAGRIARFAIADVAGHGAVVGELGATLRRLLRKHISQRDQSRIALALNHEFQKLAEEGNFATALLTTYLAESDHLIVCNAGHPRPLWRHAARGTWQFLDENTERQPAPRLTNLPLGVVEPTAYTQFAVKLDKDDLVLLYTDALVEATDEHGVDLGEQGLLALAQSIEFESPTRFLRELLAGVAGYRGHVAADDDQTLMLLQHNAADPPKRPLRDRIRTVGKMLGIVR